MFDSEDKRAARPELKNIRWPIEIRKQALDFLEQGFGPKDLSQRLGICVKILHDWKKPKKKKNASLLKEVSLPVFSGLRLICGNREVQGLRFSELEQLLSKGVI